jgi:hypothetical protein
MRRQRHSFIDLLKIDIEGAEFGLFESWIQSGYHPPAAQIWVEFHPEAVGTNPSAVARFVRRLEGIGLLPAKRAYRQNPNHYLLINRGSLELAQRGKSGN